jgi:hypothetical protein
MKPINAPWTALLCVFILACQQKDTQQVTTDDIEPPENETTSDPDIEEPAIEPSGEDNDEDGFGNSDCDDDDPNINPDAVDYSGDGIDQDCDGQDEKGLCEDSCNFADDSACDDGGIDAQYDVCPLGSDCSDCGPRRDNDEDGFFDIQDCDDDDPEINPTSLDFSGDGIDQDCDGQDFPGLCEDTCTYAGDQACDDGGPNSEFDICALGTDCSDCGPRLDGDGDGYDISEDCNDYSSQIYPGAIDDSCDGIDQNCDGVLDEGWNGDEYEPNDSSSYDLGTLYDGGSFSNISGYITDPSDVDTFSFYYEDGWGLGFGLQIDLNPIPNQVDLVLTLNHIDRSGKDTLISSVNAKGMGGNESITFEESYNNDETGTFIVRVFSTSGSTCTQNYKLSIVEAGIY